MQLGGMGSHLPSDPPDGAEPRRGLIRSGAAGEELRAFACVGHAGPHPPTPLSQEPWGRG